MDYNMNTNRERRGMCVCGNYTCMTHVIRPGDTLYRLSREYGIKVSALMMANPFVDIYNLRVGDELCIPRLRRPEDMKENEPEIMPRDNEGAGNANSAVQQPAQAESERVVDAEMNMMDSREGFMEPECPKCGGINYPVKDDTY